MIYQIYGIITYTILYNRYEFKLTEDEANNQFVLDVACPRYTI